jgi:predicted ATPase
MHLLNRDGLLYIDLDKKRWLWDVEKISQSKLPDNIALCFTTGINNLAPDVQTALHTLSTFGGSAKSDYIMFIETDLNINLINPLKVAAAEGLVSMNGAISFCHDRIQEASYNIVEEQDRVCNHLAYGKCLMKHMVDTGDDHILFTSVNQINLGGAAAVSDREDYFILAKYNLVAGKKAMGMSDFAAAFSFFDHGMSFLRKDSWKKHYDFTLELYELAAKASLAVGNNECLHLISHQVLNNAKCFDDKLDIYSTIISSLAYASKLAGALERGLDIVTKLDLDIPRDPTQDVFIHHVQRTLDMIRGLSSTDLQNYQPMKDKKRVKIMKLLSQMQLLALLVKPTIYPFIAMNMVQMSISYGKHIFLWRCTFIGMHVSNQRFIKRCFINVSYRVFLFCLPARKTWSYATRTSVHIFGQISPR